MVQAAGGFGDGDDEDEIEKQFERGGDAVGLVRGSGPHGSNGHAAIVSRKP